MYLVSLSPRVVFLTEFAGLLSIDHIALGGGSHAASRVDATGLSDHDFYIVETDGRDSTDA